MVDSTLAANLREIYHAASFPSDAHTLPLVSNFSATRIYDARYCWGRLWCWLYQMIDYATGTSWQQTKLKHALVHTHSLFHQEMGKAQTALKGYVNYLEDSGKGYCVEEESAFSSRETISSWNRSVKPFLRLNQQGYLEKMIQEIVEDQLSQPLFICPDTVLLQECQRVIDTEGVLAGPLPLALIKKIIRKKPLSPLEKKEIKRWTHKIQKSELDLAMLHKALEVLHRLYVNHNPSSRSFLSLPELELSLEDNGCGIFQKKDPKHLLWRQELEPGVQVLFGEKILTLRDKIPSQAFGDDFCIYAVEESPDLLVLVAHNRVALQLQDLRMAQQPDIGLSVVRLKSISMDGRVALIERLKPLSAYQWSTSEESVSLEDQPILEALTGLIQRCIQQNMTPIPCSPDSLMLNEAKQLAVVKPVTIGPFDFNALEDLVTECTADHPVIYRELMQLSGLDAHPVSKFYRDLRKQALAGSDVVVGDLAAIYKITDPKVVDRAVRLVRRLKYTSLKRYGR